MMMMMVSIGCAQKKAFEILKLALSHLIFINFYSWREV